MTRMALFQIGKSLCTIWQTIESAPFGSINRNLPIDLVSFNKKKRQFIEQPKLVKRDFYYEQKYSFYKDQPKLARRDFYFEEKGSFLRSTKTF